MKFPYYEFNKEGDITYYENDKNIWYKFFYNIDNQMTHRKTSFGFTKKWFYNSDGKFIKYEDNYGNYYENTNKMIPFFINNPHNFHGWDKIGYDINRNRIIKVDPFNNSIQKHYHYNGWSSIEKYNNKKLVIKENTNGYWEITNYDDNMNLIKYLCSDGNWWDINYFSNNICPFI